MSCRRFPVWKFALCLLSVPAGSLVGHHLWQHYWQQYSEVSLLKAKQNAQHVSIARPTAELIHQLCLVARSKTLEPWILRQAQGSTPSMLDAS